MENNKLYQFKDLKENEIPYKDCKIFPELQIDYHIIFDENTEKYDRIFLIRTYIPIIRNSIKYLILYMRRFYDDDQSKLDDNILPKDFQSNIISDCINYQDKFIIDGLENLETYDGHHSIIYRYDKTN